MLTSVNGGNLGRVTISYNAGGGDDLKIYIVT